MSTMREDALGIIHDAIQEVKPEAAVRKALETRPLNPEGKLVVVAVGKAAWTMASAAREMLGSRVDRGLVVTKHGHSEGPIEGFDIIEAGHPVPDRLCLKSLWKGLRWRILQT